MDLREDRLSKGYTQKEYAALLKVSERTLQYWESGEIDIDPLKAPEINRLAKKARAKK